METEGNLLQKMKNVFSDNEDKEKIAEEIIEKVLEGYEKGVLTRREMKMITNIFEYMDSDAKDIMTHRKNIVALDGEESLEKALTFMLEENKSRFPVYEEDIDNIVGILHIRDAMQSYLDGPARKKPVHDLKDAIRPAGFIPETKAIDKLFQQMQQDKSHMVIVLDEYGQTSGIVTMEDIVEEIVETDSQKLFQILQLCHTIHDICTICLFDDQLFFLIILIINISNDYNYNINHRNDP